MSALSVVLVRLRRCMRRILFFSCSFLFFFFNDPPTTEIYTLSLHDALPIYADDVLRDPERMLRLLCSAIGVDFSDAMLSWRSEEHTSELQSLRHLVCRLLLEKKHSHFFYGGGKPTASGGLITEAFRETIDSH